MCQCSSSSRISVEGELLLLLRRVDRRTVEWTTGDMILARSNIRRLLLLPQTIAILIQEEVKGTAMAMVVPLLSKDRRRKTMAEVGFPFLYQLVAA